MNEDWRQLVSSPSGDEARTFRVIAKGGEPRLYLPPGCVASAVELYPAQKPMVRLAFVFLKAWLWCGLRAPFPTVTVPRVGGTAFCRFLAKLAGRDHLPKFAVLAGNPSAGGRRFVLLVFNRSSMPTMVVKLGMGQEAERLISNEQEILDAIPERLPGVPSVQCAFSEDGVRAFALPYLPGRSPRDSDSAEVLGMLSKWIQIEEERRLADFPEWQRLMKVCGDDATFSALNLRIGGRQVRPVISHGDFAPWNIRGKRGRWMAIDWERGEIRGIPGWDWFHYVVQTGILVRRLKSDVLAARIDALLTTDEFVAYAEKSGIRGFERELALAYLAYSLHVSKPSEGVDEVAALFSLMTRHFEDSTINEGR